jgi:hypothetical protein
MQLGCLEDNTFARSASTLTEDFDEFHTELKWETPPDRIGASSPVQS